MFASNSSFNALSLSLLLMTPAAHAAPPVSQGADWAKVVEALLSVSACQDRLVQANRAKCYRNNSQQACRYLPEGVEKENCILEYSYNRVPQNAGLPSHPPRVMSPFKTDDQSLNNSTAAQAGALPTDSAPDELDSAIKILLQDKARAPVVQ